MKNNKKTYQQNWKKYDKNQEQEKLKLLKTIKKLVIDLKTKKNTKGRPKANQQDIISSILYKNYTGLSGRRLKSDLEILKKLKYIKKIYSRTTILKYQNTHETKKILQKLITKTSTPLKEKEQHFSIDSTGFATTQTQPTWTAFKHEKTKTRKKWIKTHITAGYNTKIITAVSITHQHANDSPQLKPLLKKTSEYFNIKEFSADKAYISKKNLEAINEIGAIPYIPFKKNVNPKSRGKPRIWKKSLKEFLQKPEQFYKKYHNRNNHAHAKKQIQKLRTKPKLDKPSK